MRARIDGLIQERDITDMNGGIIPDNPIAFVFAGEDAAEKYRQVYRFWGDADYIIYIQILGEGEERIEDEQAVIVETDTDGALQNGDEYFECLDKVIRRTKRHCYVNHADIDVIVLAEEQTSAQMAVICREMYHSFFTAYFNHVFFEIYFWIVENFSDRKLEADRKRKFFEQVACLEEIEWVRFIFLISEVMNTERLVKDKSIYTRIAVDSAILGNCSGNRMGRKGISIYSDLLERTAVTDSKLLTIGRVSLEISHAVRKIIFCMCLLEKISEVRVEKTDIKNMQYTDRGIIERRISAELAELQKGLPSVSCHENISFDQMGLKRMEDILYKCFYNNHTEYMRINSPVYKKECEAAVQNYCNTQLEGWLNENICRFTKNVFDDKEIDSFVGAVRQKYKEKVTDAQTALKRQREAFYGWTQQKSMKASRRIRKEYRDHFQMYLLSEWGRYYISQLNCEMVLESIKTMQYYLINWKDKMYAKRQTYFQYLKMLRHQYDIVFSDSCKPEQMELERYRKSLYRTLERNPAFVENCYKSLSRRICESQETSRVIEEALAQFMDDMRMVRENDGERAGSQEEGSNEQKSFYSELYKEIVSEKLFHTRGSICNIQPYICIMGSREGAFIQYGLKNNEEEKIIYDVECCRFPVVMYYQHIDRVEELFLHSFYSPGGEEG